MSATSSRPGDPRAARTRAAVVAAATALFLRDGYAGTTMDAIAVHAGVARRSLYNVFRDKDSLLLAVVADITGFAERFARELGGELAARIESVGVRSALAELGPRLAVAIVRPEVIGIRRLLISEARTFPELARSYFTRAPGRVIVSLAAVFGRLMERGLLVPAPPRRAAEQFAYLIAGAPLDRAMLEGSVPSKREVVAGAAEGVRTFWSRYGTAPRRRPAVRAAR